MLFIVELCLIKNHFICKLCFFLSNRLSINSLLASNVCEMMTLSISLDQDEAQQNVGSDLDLNCLMKL